MADLNCPCGLRDYMEAADCEKTPCCDCCPLQCDDGVDLWGVQYCRLVGKPCTEVGKCPKLREQEKPEA